MTKQEIAKRVVNAICIAYTRGTLEWMAEECGYRNTHKFSRSKLENIVYIDKVILDEHAKYAIIDTVTGCLLKQRVSRKSTIDYIMRECFCNWYDECVEPELKTNRHIIKVVGVVDNA